MAFKKYTTPQLKKYKKNLLIFAILGLVVMSIALGVGIYQINQQKDSSLIFLIPTVFAPISIIPSLISANITNEIKRRDKEKHSS